MYYDKRQKEGKTRDVVKLRDEFRKDEIIVYIKGEKA